MNNDVKKRPKIVLVFCVGESGESFNSFNVSHPSSTSPVKDAIKQTAPPAMIPPQHVLCDSYIFMDKF